MKLGFIWKLDWVGLLGVLPCSCLAPSAMAAGAAGAWLFLPMLLLHVLVWASLQQGIGPGFLQNKAFKRQRQKFAPQPQKSCSDASATFYLTPHQPRFKVRGASEGQDVGDVWLIGE